MEGKTLQTCGQPKKRNNMVEKYTKYKCGKPNEPIWPEIKIDVGKLLKSGLKDRLD